jgi:cell division protein FtsB
MDDATAIKLLLAALGTLTGAVVLLWRLREAQVTAQIAALQARVTLLETHLQEWQTKWSEAVKERAKDSELFLNALKRRREPSSDPPRSST